MAAVPEDLTAHRMTVSRSGQVSIPAAARRRWGRAKTMIVLDLGDRVVMRPASDNPIRDLVGKYAGRAPSTNEMLDEKRAEIEAEEARYS